MAPKEQCAKVHGTSQVKRTGKTTVIILLASLFCTRICKIMDSRRSIILFTGVLNDRCGGGFVNRTPLYKTHLKCGGKMIDFGGWEMPVQYGSIIEEHMAVRQNAGIFDVSHMGELLVQGTDSEAFIQKIAVNDISGLKDGGVRYSPMCYPDGGTVDDILVYRRNKEAYLLVVNASNIQKDFEWLVQNRQGSTEIINVSSEYGQIALQGPKAQLILQKIVSRDLNEIGFFRFKEQMDADGLDLTISRTGYTGEDGFEILVDADYTPELWDLLIDAGEGEGLLPAGLGARDTLRFEAALPLYGHELSKDISPLEAGLSRFVKLDKNDFIGRTALLAQMEHGLDRMLVGFEMVERGIARNGYEVFGGGEKIGFVTSGSFSPSTGKNLGLAILKQEFSQPGTEIDVIIRERAVKAKVVTIPFYSKKYRK